jgi:hypothetical protein
VRFLLCKDEVEDQKDKRMLRRQDRRKKTGRPELDGEQPRI